MKFAVTTLGFCVAVLLALGLVMLYSSSMTRDGAHYLMLQCTWCVCGLTLCAIVTAFDYQLLRKFAWPIYLLALVLLALVLVPHVGLRVNGARRWLGFHGVRFEPSEFAKLALVILLAWYGHHFQRQMPTWSRGIVLPGVLIALLLGLMFVEPDWGATILLATIGGAMLLLAGVRWRHFIPPLVFGAVALAISLLVNPLRRRRIFSWWDLQQHKDGVGYQAYQAMIALGAGGWNGLGLGNGRQKLGFVPEDHTDFILSVIGEELGLIATLFIVLAFVIIVVCGIYIALHSRDTFGFLLGAGVTLLIGLQAAINIGVVTSALPNKGLPLPFISYGGSNLMAMFACVGILFSIARHASGRTRVAASAIETDDLSSAQAT